MQDLQGHGTHVATTIAGAVNGIGIAGVAPDATIVALKACTIAGFCFADSVAAALRYAGDQRLDVVNLSLFADPYLYYCTNDAEQRAILKDLTERRALRAAARRGRRRLRRQRGGRSRPSDDRRRSARTGRRTPPIEREVRNNCRVAPAELPGVVTVSATGVSQLASYSNVGNPVDVTAPGGDAAQTPATTFGRILAGWSSTDATGTWEAFAAADRGGRRAAADATCGSAARRWRRRTPPVSPR